MAAPSPENLRELAKAGYTFPRIADRYGCGVRLVKQIAKLCPDAEAQIMANGKIRTERQKLFGNHFAGPL